MMPGTGSRSWYVRSRGVTPSHVGLINREGAVDVAQP